ncbi:hypothetical protein PP707_02160 [Acetobacter pasteurianus]|nr:hypothetical protein [Acetobacter pasteurianus]
MTKKNSQEYETITAETAATTATVVVVVVVVVIIIRRCYVREVSILVHHPLFLPLLNVFYNNRVVRFKYP